MSNWLHVAGIVRIDNIRLAMVNQSKVDQVNALKDIFGQEKIDFRKDFKDVITKRFEENIPRGSEGTMKLTVLDYPVEEDWDKYDPKVNLSQGSLYWGDVIFSGDLRDEDNFRIISNWLNSIEIPEGCMVRNGVATIDDETSIHVVHWSSDDSRWIIS